MTATPIPALAASIALDTPADITTGTVADITNGNTTPNSGHLHLIIQNTVASPDTVNVTRTETVDGATVAARAITLPASKTVMVGPFSPQIFGALLQYKAGLVTTKFIPIVI